MSNNAILLAVMIGSLFIFLLLLIALPRWIFRVDERTRYLKQICEELKKLNKS